MTQPISIIIRPSLLRLLGVLTVGSLGVVGGLLLIFGPGTILAVSSAVTSGVCIFFFAVAAVRQRPRVILTSEGFEVHKLFGCESHKWNDIDGQFAVIKIGFTKAVAFNCTAGYKIRVGKKSVSYFSGYDAAISGTFNCSAEELAEILNARRLAACG